MICQYTIILLFLIGFFLESGQLQTIAAEKQKEMSNETQLLITYHYYNNTRLF